MATVVIRIRHSSPMPRSRHPPILVMQATQNWEGNHFLGGTACLIGALFSFWNLLVDALVGPGTIKVSDLLLEDASQMCFAYNHDVIQTFPAHAAEQPFADRIRPWGLDRRSQHSNPGTLGDCSEVGAVLRIVIADQVLRRLAKGRGFPRERALLIIFRSRPTTNRTRCRIAGSITTSPFIRSARHVAGVSSTGE